MVGRLIDVGLIFGCYGFKPSDRFCICSGVDNKILYFHHLDSDISDNVIEFLTLSCGLLNDDASDYNKVTNIISYLHKTYNLFGKEELHNIQLFIRTHRSCGLYMKLFESKEIKNDK